MTRVLTTNDGCLVKGANHCSSLTAPCVFNTFFFPLSINTLGWLAHPAFTAVPSVC
jgi:hypothetical protein